MKRIVSAKTSSRKPAKKRAPARKVAKEAPAKSTRKVATKARPTPRRRKPVRKRAKPSVAVYHPGPLIDSDSALHAALDALTLQDAALVGKMIAAGGRPPLRRREPGFAGLAWIIVSQQVSTASANAIFKRLTAEFDPLTAPAILGANDETLRRCGLSSPKMRALRALAATVVDGGLDLQGLGALAAEEAHRALVAVKGIGPWTADIFLLFCLGHPDAFPAGDLALQEAARVALGLRKRPDARGLEKIAERWRPLRGVAARLLWAYYRVARGAEGMALAGATS